MPDRAEFIPGADTWLCECGLSNMADRCTRCGRSRVSGVSPSLVEAAVRTMREWGVSGTDDWLTILAEEVLVAVGDALRLEGAQAERERGQREDAAILAYGEGVRAERERTLEVIFEVANSYQYYDLEGFATAIREALGGVHPEAAADPPNTM